MAWRNRRGALRAILEGSACVRPASVYDAISVRIADDLGFPLGMFGGSVASLAILGDPDIALITLTELSEQVRRISRVAALPVVVDADHGYGNALNVRRTVEELEAAGAAGLTIEDTLLPQAYGEAKPQLVSREEGLGKINAALDARRDSSLVIIGRTGACSITSLDDAIDRAAAYEQAGVDALFFTGVKTRDQLDAISAATTLPLALGSPPAELADWGYLAAKRVRIAVQGHAPIAAATEAVSKTLSAIAGGAAPKQLTGLASADLIDKVTRADIVAERGAHFLGLKRP